MTTPGQLPAAAPRHRHVRTFPAALLLTLLTLLPLTVGCSSAADDAASDAQPSATPTTGLTTAAPSGSAEPESDALPRTRAPALAYVDGRTLRRPDGSTVELPRRWRVTSIEAYAGGFLVTDDRSFEGTVGMHRLDGDGRVLASWGSTGPALSDGEGRIAWVSLVPGEGGETGPTLVHVDSVDGGSERTVELDRDRVPFLVRWFRGEVVYRTWGQEASFATDGSTAPRPVPLAAELGVPSPDGRQWARVTKDEVVLRQGDGQLLDVVRERGLGRSALATAVWEDGRHLLTTLTRGREMALARIDTRNGSVSLATDWQRASYAGLPVLPAR